MASFTENYNLIKPGQEDIYNIGDFNDNADIIDAELKDRVPKTGDISSTQIATFDIIAGEFPVPAAGESTKTVAGKIRKFIQDFNSFKTGILTVGMLVNNAVTNNSQLPVSAAVAKVLQDQVTKINNDLTTVVDYASGFEAVLFSDNVTLYTLYSCYKIAKRLRVSALLKLNDNVVGATSPFTVLHLANATWSVPAKSRIVAICRYGSAATHIQQMNIPTNGVVQLFPRGDVSTSQYIIVDFDIDTTTIG